MQTSSRDKVITLVLPSLVVVLGCSFLILLPHQRAMSALQKSAKSARDIPAPVEFSVRQHKLAALQAEVARLQATAKTLSREWDDLSAPCLDHSARSHRLTRLLTMLNQHGLRVIEHGPADSARDTRDLRLSAAQERLVKVMSERGNKQTPQPWRLQLSGSYGDLRQALQSLSSEDRPLAIPLGVIMKEAALPASHHEWAVILWI